MSSITQVFTSGAKVLPSQGTGTGVIDTFTPNSIMPGTQFQHEPMGLKCR